MMRDRIESTGRWVSYFLALLASLAGAVTLTLILRPLPPTSLTLAVPAGMTTEAQRYRTYLRQQGIDLRLKVSYADPNDVDPSHLNEADAALVLGLNSAVTEARFVSLGTVDRLPVWLLFKRGAGERVAQFQSGRVGYNSADKYSVELFTTLIQSYGREASPYHLVPIQPRDDAKQLQQKQIDVLITLHRDNSATLQKLVRKDGWNIADIENIEAWRRMNPRLARITLARASFDYYSDIPHTTRSTVAVRQHLVISKDMHPALQRLLMDAATMVHSTSGVLKRAEEFPDFGASDFRLSEIVQAYALGNRPFMERVLSYWWAQLFSSLLYAFIPFLLFGYLLIMQVDRYFDQRAFRSIEIYYGELAYLEMEMESLLPSKPILITEFLHRLDDIERRVAELEVPKSHQERWLTLRQHTVTVRQKLLFRRGR